MEEQIQQFELVESTTGHSYRKDPTHGSILRSCMELQRQLVHEYLQTTVNNIVGQTKDRHVYDNNHSLIITVHFQKNQAEDHPIFIKNIFNKFDKDKHQIFPDLSPQKIDVVCVMKSDVRDIALNMYICLQERPQFDLTVFVVSEMSDLDEFNIYCFQKGLKGKKLILVICTHHQFGEAADTVNEHEHFLKLHYRLYNAKELFCQYVYRCLAHQTIKPYLPSQVLKLITDMNYYTISYKESCRRFRYCVERALMLFKKQRTWVEFQGLLDLLEFALMKEFKNYPGNKRIPKEKLLKIILSEEEQFHISEKLIGLQIVARTTQGDQKLVQENDLIAVMRERLKNRLTKSDKYKKYAQYLLQQKQQNVPTKPGRKKKSRSQLLGIDTKNNITAKNLLENQVTKIIKEATAGIRQQAAHIRWQDIKYESRIKPQLPYLIKQAWAAEQDAAELVEEITKNYSAPLVHYLNLFDKNTLGKGIYLIKCLELAGLVEIKKVQVRPMVYTSFFDKANFKVLS